ncbi:MAG: formylglycine-generating enzyme family protein, partial [Planctomycetota bacterium]
LGATLFQMVTGSQPYAAETHEGILDQHINAPVPDPKAARPNLSDHVAGIITKMMAKDPNQRFQSTEELMPVLQEKSSAPDEREKTPETIGSHDTKVRKVRQAPPEPEAKKRLPVWIWLLIGAGGVAAILLILWFPRASQKTPSPTPMTPEAVYFSLEYPKTEAIFPSPEVEVRGAVQEGVSIYVNGTAAPLEGKRFQVKIRLPGIGRQTLSILAVKGDRNQKKEIQVVIDDEDPRIELEGVEDELILYTNRNPYPLQGRVVDAHPRCLRLFGAEIELEKDGRFIHNLSFPSQGRMILLLEGEDGGGRRMTRELEIVLDEESPVVQLVSPLTGKVEGKPEQTLRFRFNEPVKQVKVDGQTEAPFIEEFLDLKRTLAKGENRLVIEGIDRAGNAVRESFSVHYVDPVRAKREAAKREWAKVLSVLQGDHPLPDKIATLEEFLKTYGQPPGGVDARKELASLKAKWAAVEKEAPFLKACAASDAENDPADKVRAFERFLENHPRGKFADEARSRIKMIKAEAIPLKLEGIDLGPEPATFLNKKDEAQLVHVPPGSVPFGEGASEAGETPPSVRLSGFYIYRFEVTNRQFSCFMNSEERKSETAGHPYIFDCMTYRGGRYPWGMTKEKEKCIPVKGYEDYPAVLVTWHGAKAYAKWAGGALPSEAQWEYAARGPKGHSYPWGDIPPNETLLHYQSESPITVGMLPKGVSPFGALDMAGNVWEWCLDPFVDSPGFKAGDRDPLCEEDSFTRVLKGGGYKSGPEACKATSRSGLAPMSAHPWLG